MSEKQKQLVAEITANVEKLPPPRSSTSCSVWRRAWAWCPDPSRLGKIPQQRIKEAAEERDKGIET